MSLSSLRRHNKKTQTRTQLVEQLESRVLFDLVPTIPGTVPSAAIATERVRDAVVVDLTNSGASPINGSYSMELFVSPDGMIGDATPIGTVTKNLPKLGAGKTRAVSFAISQFPLVSNGPYHILAEVGGSLAGIGDNTAASGGTVTITDPFIDLSDSISFLGALDTKPSHKSVVAVTVLNNGNVPAKGALAINLGFSLASNGASPMTVDTATVKINIGAGKHSVFRFTNTVPVNPISNTYFAIAAVDPGDTFSESDTTNNFAVSPNMLTYIDTFPDVRADDTGTLLVTKGSLAGQSGTSEIDFTSETFTNGKIAGVVSATVAGHLLSSAFTGTISDTGLVKIHGGVFSLTGELASGTITGTVKVGTESGTFTVS